MSEPVRADIMLAGDYLVVGVGAGQPVASRLILPMPGPLDKNEQAILSQFVVRPAHRAEADAKLCRDELLGENRLAGEPIVVYDV